MATKKISELEAITEADDSDVLAIVDVSEGKTNKITKNNLLIGAGHSIEMSLNQETYALTLTLKNAAGTELSTASIDLPNENSITDISYNNGKLTLTKQSGATTEVDITGLINGLVTETALNNLANALKETIGIQTTTYNESQTYNTGDIVVQNEKIYKANQDNITGTFDSSKWDEISLYEYQKIQDEAIEENYKVITKLQEDVEDLTERMEDAENNEMTNTPTPATSHYLQDSAGSRFRKFIPIGRTTQESTMGRNLVYNTLLPRTASGVTITYDASRDVYKLTGTASNNANGYIITYSVPIVSLNANESIEIYIERVSGTKKVQFMCYFVPDDESATDYSYYAILNENQTGIVRNVKTPTKSGKVAYVQFYFASGTTYNDEVRIMVSKTLNAAYEPYTGGEPAPNPNYPYAIKNTGDNGSINEKVQNKNFAPFTNQDFTLNNVRYYAQNGSLYLDGTSTSETNTSNVNFKNNFSFILKPGNYFLNKGNILTNLGVSIAIRKYSDNTVISALGNFTLDEETKVYLGFYVYQKTFNNVKTDIQLEEGSTPTSYVPHSEQNLSFPLAEGQKLYEGSHPDDDEKVHHKWNQLTITEAMVDKTIITSYSKLDYIRFGTPRGYIGNGKTNTALMSCANENTDWSFNDKKYIGTFTNKIQYNYFYIGIPKGTTYNEIKDKIIGQTLVYKLAEEQTEDFTEEQKEAWEQIKKARTYKNITHISSEDETPANVEIEYVRDLETVINNLTTRVETIESEV